MQLNFEKCNHEDSVIMINVLNNFIFTFKHNIAALETSTLSWRLKMSFVLTYLAAKSVWQVFFPF